MEDNKRPEKFGQASLATSWPFGSLPPLQKADGGREKVMQRQRDSLEPGTAAAPAAAALITIEHLQSHCPNLRSARPILARLSLKAWRLVLAFIGSGLWKNIPSAPPPPLASVLTLDSISLCCSIPFASSTPLCCQLCFGCFGTGRANAEC